MKPYNIELLKRKPDRFEPFIKERIYTEFTPVEGEVFVSKEPLAFERRTEGQQKHVVPGEEWADELFDCGWFHFKGSVPEDYQGKHVVLVVDVNGEGLIVDDKGYAVQGITSNCVYDDYLGVAVKRIVQLSAVSKDGKNIDFWMDAGNNDLFGREKPHGKFGFVQADVAVCNDEIRELYYDFSFLNDLRKAIGEEDSPLYMSYLYALVEAERALCDFSEQNVAQARAILGLELKRKGGDEALTFTAIGHSHLDLAWLWPIRESKRKAVRTFANAAANMERYADYVFAASQPQQLEWIKDSQPKLFNKITELTAKGRIEPVGGSWVESDVNITGGESLVRQFLYGQRFYEKEFGRLAENLWLPDVFGFCAALPQLMARAGMRFMATTKINWAKGHNNCSYLSDFPFQTFVWQGISGHEVLVHMPPESNYNSSAAPRGILRAQKNYVEKGLVADALMMFGVGDGGGGPGTHHLESLKREKHIAGMPKVEQGSVQGFFERLEAQRDRLGVYRGELYLESHQGTLTTHADVKYFNRRTETLLRAAELGCVIEMLLKPEKEYPSQLLHSIWKDALLFQFHDILPGSSIGRVYDDEVLPRYREMEGQLKVQLECLGIADEKTGYPAAVKRTKSVKSVFNSLSFEVTEVIDVNGESREICAQPLGYTPVSSAKMVRPILCAEQGRLENDRVEVRLSGRGELTYFALKAGGGRSAVKEGGNILKIYGDTSDAWDYNMDYEKHGFEQPELVKSRAYVEGIYAVNEFAFVYRDSTIVQKIRLKAGADYVEFQTAADWRERCKMLRTDFYTDVFTDEVKCDIQFGSIKRSTLCGKASDAAQFEVCAHKYAQLTEGNFSVALLNDCKYGYKAKDNRLSLCLLRGSVYPDAHADEGEHAFSYALHVCEGDNNADIVANVFNRPLIPCAVEKDFSLLSVLSGSVLAEAIKKCEDSDDIILRLYEYKGARTSAQIKLNFSAQGAALCDLLEREERSVQITDGFFKLDFKAFEIHTVKLKAPRV